MDRKRATLAAYLFLGLLFAWHPVDGQAATARDKFFKAEACYRQLKQSSAKQKYRENWMTCIEKFEEVYRHNPGGAWAAAGLYKTGELYEQLFRRSFKPSDRQEAIDIFKRLVNRYPKSRYRRKAETMLGAFEPQPPSAPTEAPPGETTTAKQHYLEAEKCFRSLDADSKARKYRSNWERCIDRFQAAYSTQSDGPWAAASLYRMGELQQGLYGYSRRPSDLQDARASFTTIAEKYPQSLYHAKALSALKDLPGATSATSPPATATGQDTSDASADAIADVIAEATPAPKTPDPPPAGKSDGAATVSGLRYWSNPNYTRIVIDADEETSYSHRLLKKDPAIQKPQRLYVDLDNSRLRDGIQKVVPINDDLLSDARAGQYTQDAVRVVVDIKSFKTYKIFSLKNPFRIVIDVWGTQTDNGTSLAQKLPDAPKIPGSALTRQLALGVSRIVIDPGHGGKDYGAPGYLKGVHEKDVTLAIAQRLAAKIRSEIKCEVIMTRTDDRYLTLEERTAIANTRNADLFISIHTNAAHDHRAYGIETYFLNLATDDEAIMVAARENATSAKNISDLQTILNDLMQNAKINESSRLALQVQGELFQNMKSKYSRIKNKGVKQAPFYVLLGAQMPSILIETAFISNPRECKRLTDTHYQDLMSAGIIAGIKKYIEEISPTAFLGIKKEV